MPLHRKNVIPEQLGAKLYEHLRAHLGGNGEISLAALLEALDVPRSSMHTQFVGDVMIALMFSGVLAIERSANEPIANRITSGMKTEFLNHLSEQGANEVERAEWEATIASSFLLYRETLRGYSGFEPPWKLGRRFYWNLIDREEYSVMPIKISTLYLLSARDSVQEVLNEYGPAVKTT